MPTFLHIASRSNVSLKRNEIKTPVKGNLDSDAEQIDEQMQVIKGKVNDGYSWTISITGDLADSLTATKEEKNKTKKG